MPDNNEHGKHHVRTLVEFDAEGRDRSTSTVYDFRAMLRDAFPELKEEQKEKQPDKTTGQLIPFKPSE